MLQTDFYKQSHFNYLGPSMHNPGKIILLTAGLNLILTAPTFAGPPFLTDDPVPVDYHHWELYLFGNGDHAGINDFTINGPAMELNYGALPETQLHLVLPMTTVDDVRWRRRGFEFGARPEELSFWRLAGAT
jgi:hypothetical protein